MSERVEIIIGAKDKFSGAFDKLIGKLPSVKQLAIGTGAAVAGMGTALFAMAKTTATSYDQVRKFSDQLGVSTEFLSKHGLAAEFSGIKQETFNKSIQMLQVRIGEAARDIGQGKDAMEALGVQIRDSNNQLKTSEQILPELADAFLNMSNATERAEAASKIFGQRGMAMLQMFKDGSAGLSEMTKEAEKFGLVISDKAANNAAEFNDSLTRVTGSLTGVKNAIAEKLLPTFTGLANAFANFIADNRQGIVNFADTFLTAFGAMAEYTSYGVASMVEVWRALKISWQGLKLAFIEFSFGINTGIEFIVDKFQWMLEKINFRGIFDNDIALLGAVKSNVQGAIDEIVNMETQALSSISNLMGEESAFAKVDQLKEYITNALAEIRAAGQGEEGGGDSGSTSFIVPPQEKLEEEIARAVEAGEKMKDLWQIQHEEKYEVMSNALEMLKEESDVYGDILAKTFDNVSMGIAQAAGAAIFESKNIGDALKSLMKSVLQTTVVTLIKIGVERLILMGKNLMAGTTENVLRMGQLSQQTYAGAFAATAAIPIVGPMLAPSVAMASLASMLAGSGAAKGAGAASGAAHGGLENVPKESTYLLDRGERVLSPRQNQDLMRFMESGGAPTVNVEQLNVYTQENLENVDWPRLTEEEIKPALTKLVKAGFPI
jgi:hypothetical protein